jgi:hypothetical protein
MTEDWQPVVGPGDGSASFDDTRCWIADVVLVDQREAAAARSSATGWTQLPMDDGSILCHRRPYVGEDDGRAIVAIDVLPPGQSELQPGWELATAPSNGARQAADAHCRGAHIVYLRAASATAAGGASSAGAGAELVDVAVCTTMGGCVQVCHGFQPCEGHVLAGRTEREVERGATGPRPTSYLCFQRAGWEAHFGPRDAPLNLVKPPPPGVADAEGLARAFVPRFFLEGNDRYWPSSVAAHLSTCELWFGSGARGSAPDCGDVCVLRQGEVTAAALVRQRQSSALAGGAAQGAEGSDATESSSSSRGIIEDDGRVRHDGRWRLRIAPDALPAAHYGAHAADVDLDEAAPVYARVRPGVACVHGVEVVSIVYTTFYPYNGAYKILRGWAMAGGHEADVEHVTVHVARRTGQLHSVWFHAHRARDGTLKRAEEIDCDSGGHPRVYVARNGHGHYWDRGTYPRLFGVANDRCGQGRLWQPTPVLLPDTRDAAALAAADLEWLVFPGRLGTPYEPYRRCSREEEASRVVESGGSPPGPACQDWWAFEECVSRSTLKRLFMPGAE